MLKYNTEIPVLLLVFNRPELTTKVFQRIKAAQPKYLYIAADGPRDREEKLKTDEVRAIFENVDWDCKVLTLFRSVNLGCGKAVSEGILWFFKHVEEGIVLEDDCLPNQSFFAFCSTLLSHYRYDERIGHISGSNFQGGIKRGDADYYFSALTHVWGWAGWRRVWKEYDYHIKSYPQMNTNFEAFPAHQQFVMNWKQIFDSVYTGKIDTWDYQYAYLNLKKGYKSIIPNVNLIENIGLGISGTHTSFDHPLGGNKYSELNTLLHPTEFYHHVSADVYTQSKEFCSIKKNKNVFSLIWKNIKLKLK